MLNVSASPAAIEAARKPADPHTDQPQTIADDRLRGAEAIGKFIDPSLTPRETRRLLEDGFYPCWREGRVYVASKAALLKHWREKTTATFSPQAPKRRGRLMLMHPPNASGAPSRAPLGISAQQLIPLFPALHVSGGGCRQPCRRHHGSRDHMTQAGEPLPQQKGSEVHDRN